MSSPVPPVLLGDSHLGAVRHVCAFFRNDDDAYRVLLPFIIDGLQHGQKTVHVLRAGHPFFVPPDQFLRERRGEAARQL
jgi:hypothetical protein